MTLPSDLAVGALRHPEAKGAPHPVRVATAVLSRTVVGSMVGLLVWAHLPVMALGWTAGVVQSGSMRPALVPGDVVLYQPLLRVTAPRRWAGSCWPRTPPDPVVCLPTGSTGYFPATN